MYLCKRYSVAAPRTACCGYFLLNVKLECRHLPVLFHQVTACLTSTRITYQWPSTYTTQSMWRVNRNCIHPFSPFAIRCTSKRRTRASECYTCRHRGRHTIYIFFQINIPAISGSEHVRLFIGEQHKPEAKATSILCFICNLVHLEYNSEGARKPLFYLIVLPYIYNCELKIAILKIALNTFL